MSNIFYPFRQQQASHDPHQRRQQRASQRIARLFYFRRHKIHRHSVEDRLRTSHHDRYQSAEKGIRSVFFENIQNQSGGGAGREHPHDGNRDKLCGKAHIPEKMSQDIREHIQKPRGPQDADGYHQPDQRGHDPNDRVKAVHCAFDKGFVYVLLFQQPVSNHDKQYKGYDVGREKDQKIHIGTPVCGSVCSV